MFKIYKYVDQDTDQNRKFEDEQEHEESEGFEADEDQEGFDSLDDPEEQEDQNEDFQGVIRTVPGACLVYKRKTENNTYEELWVYNAGGRDMKPEIKIRKSILAGTDIDSKTERSPEGDQVCETITVGNVQFLHITGLIN